MSDDSKSRSPASKITDAQCLAAMRECAAQKGESHDAMWSQMDAQVRAELIGEWRAILECAGVSGQEPVTWGLLDVGSNPPRISGDIFDERNAKANESSGWRAVPLYLGAGRSPAEVPPAFMHIVFSSDGEHIRWWSRSAPAADVVAGFAAVGSAMHELHERKEAK